MSEKSTISLRSELPYGNVQFPSLLVGQCTVYSQVRITIMKGKAQLEARLFISEAYTYRAGLKSGP